MSRDFQLPPPADKIVACFVDRLCSLAGPEFIEGVYITGSIPLYDYHPGKSDIDFIVLCRTLPDKHLATQIRDLHRTLDQLYGRPGLSGSYLSTGSLQTADPEQIKVLSWHEDALRYRLLDMAPVSLCELKHTALTVLGPKAETLPVALTAEDLKRFLHRNINTYWRRWLGRHSALFQRKILLLLFPRLTEWAVLGMARQLCTLQTGEIVSKSAAGYYCLTLLPTEFHPVIRDAIAIRSDDRVYPLLGSYAIRPSLKRLSQTIACVAYMIRLFNKTYDRQPNR